MAEGNQSTENLKSLEITVDGQTLRYLVDEDTYNNSMIHEDQESIDELYARHLSKEVANPPRVEVAGPADDNVMAEETASEDTFVDGGDNVHVPEEIDGSTVASGESQNQKWVHESTLLLIALYSEMRHLFNDSRYKAYEVWKMISAKMAEKGYKFPGHDCDKKWRNLKASYKNIVDKNSKSGRGRSTWKYFDQMDQILAGDPAVTPLVVVSSGQEPVFSSAAALPSRKRKISTGSRASTSPVPLQLPEAEVMDTPVRAGTPPTRSSTPSSEEDGVVAIRRRRRSGSREAPVWLMSFHDENKRRFDVIADLSRQSIDVQTERNATLNRLTDAILAMNNKS